jgi:hypothetical protein
LITKFNDELLQLVQIAAELILCVAVVTDFEFGLQSGFMPLRLMLISLAEPSLLEAC